MKLFIIIIIGELILYVYSYGKDFGEYYIEIDSVIDPLPKNDIVDYRFRISKANKFEKQLTAEFQVHRRLEDLKIQTELCKKSKKLNSAEYQILYPMGSPKSFCLKTEQVYPVFRKRLEPKIDEEFCGMEKGNYTLNPYSIEEEFRGFVGNKTFYGGYKAKIIVVEGDKNNPVFGYQLFYTVKSAANSPVTNSTSKSKKQSKRNEVQAKEKL